MDTRIPIVFASDNNFFPIMSVAIQSVMENSNKNNQYKIFVLYSEKILPEYFDIMKKQVSVFPNFEIAFNNVSKDVATYTFKKLETAVGNNITTYLRLLIPYMFSDYKQVIYIDCDVICLTDVAGILDISSMSCMINAIIDVGFFLTKHQIGYPEKYLGINSSKYFNAGILVFNTNEFARNISKEKLFSIATAEYRAFHDQDLLNIVCKDKTNYLPMRWNMALEDLEIPKKTPIEIKSQILSERREKPCIIHYARIDKPWKNRYIRKIDEAFWLYAFKTPFIDTIFNKLSNTKKQDDINALKTEIYSLLKEKSLGLVFILKCIYFWLFEKHQTRKKMEINYA